MQSRFPVATFRRCFHAASGGLAGICLAAGLAAGAIAQEAHGSSSADPLYTVRGVPVDVSDQNAARAKLRAIAVAQVKAFRILVDRLCMGDAVEGLKNLQPKAIGRMMETLSIEHERTGPRRYLGEMTVRFLPQSVREAFDQFGASCTEERAGRILVVPIWQDGRQIRVWRDNPWRRAWLAMAVRDSLVPIVIPSGEEGERFILPEEQVILGNRAQLEALRAKYDAQTVVAAWAVPLSPVSIRASMSGETTLGPIDIDRHIESEKGIEVALEQAASTFHAIMVRMWLNERARTVDDMTLPPESLVVSAPFTSLEEWEMIRFRLAQTASIDEFAVVRLAHNGARVRLTYGVMFSELEADLAMNGLRLDLIGNLWVLRP